LNYWERKLMVALHSLVPDPSKVFVVHGRDLLARDAFFTFLSALGLRPIEWSEAIKLTRSPNPFIGEILNAAFSNAQAVLVLLTPDDEARLKAEFVNSNDPEYERELTPQARPNALFEAGMAMGRSPDRTIFVELGCLRPFSDIAGRHTIRFDGSTEKRQELADRLRMTGCPVILSGTWWQNAGQFPTYD
jgi:predicted nucleotide-binding protein